MSTGKNTKHKNQYSIRENTTIMAANLVRASSFVLADMALGSLSNRSAGAAPIGASDPVLQRDPAMMDMRRVENGSHSTGYVMELDDGNRVDTMAAEYILKFRQKNRSDAATAANISNSSIPPPPSKKSWAT